MTAVHKANIMKLSDGLFLKVCKRLPKSSAVKGFMNAMICASCAVSLRAARKWLLRLRISAAES